MFGCGFCTVFQVFNVQEFLGEMCIHVRFHNLLFLLFSLEDCFNGRKQSKLIFFHFSVFKFFFNNYCYFCPLRVFFQFQLFYWVGFRVC